ncbi:hypothetical protein Rxycam_02503 [Rubrobacter xylanophilus DSM 9941]|nr:hypothetical protein Rxycam_02503 [Rubrobacter xylanophilus DSM 9941]
MPSAQILEVGKISHRYKPSAPRPTENLLSSSAAPHTRGNHSFERGPEPGIGMALTVSSARAHRKPAGRSARDARDDRFQGSGGRKPGPELRRLGLSGCRAVSSRQTVRLGLGRHRMPVGREAEKRLLREAISSGEPPFGVLYVFGVGGSGRTALLREFAYLRGEAGGGALSRCPAAHRTASGGSGDAGGADAPGSRPSCCTKGVSTAWRTCPRNRPSRCTSTGRGAGRSTVGTTTPSRLRL